MKIYYNPKLKALAKDLRKNTTYSERLLWKYLKERQLLGFQFMRQKPIDNYIVDFYCSQLHLVIEIDGETHNGKQKYDTQREMRLKKYGLEIIRLDGNYVINNITGSLELITKKIKECIKKTTPCPPFLRGWEDGIVQS